MLAGYIQSIIRTVAALIVGWLLSLPLAHPVLVALGQTDVSAATKEKIVAALMGLLATLYYALVRVLERRWPQLTVLLGSTAQPVAYTAGSTNVTGKPGVGTLPPDVDLNAGRGIIADPTPAPFIEGGGAPPDVQSPAPAPLGGDSPAAPA